MTGKGMNTVDADHDWMAGDDHRTLTRAVEIKADPKRMAAVRRHHRKQARTLSQVGKVLGGKR
jgi:hypothetical protein